MKNEFNPKTDYKFFSAANSRSGFVNFFEDTFSRKVHKKVYILKGGPGTGKSTLLKRLCAFADERALYNEAIYCSSDINSLDGVIISDGTDSVAIFDGTAPHSSDTKAPGAADVLVDLGRAWDERGLEKRKEEIIGIGERKSLAYSKAYNELSKIEKYTIKSKAENELDKNNRDASTLCQGKHSIRLISAFTKSGYTTIDTLNKISRDIKTLSGSFDKVQNDLRKIRKELIENGVDVVSIPSPIDTDILEAIYITKSATTIAAYEIDKEDFSNGYLPSYIEPYRAVLENAKSALKEASDLHFELEAIYTPLMDFYYIDFIYTDLLSKINCQLQI